MGLKFGRLADIDKGSRTKFGHQKWVCWCECGNVTEVIGYNLISKGDECTSSCGCLAKEITSEISRVDLTGQRFDMLTVLRRGEPRLQANGNKYNTYWVCQCDCGSPEKEIVHSSLRNGSVMSCGCYRASRKGETHQSWKGGLTPLVYYLRNHIRHWKDESMAACGYRCVITSKYFNVIHHLYSFNSILKEVVEKFDILIRASVEEYEQEELDFIREKFLKAHSSYGYGVCLTEELHKEFHRRYGIKGFTPENFYEFYKEKTGRDFCTLQETEWYAG
jgi:hypothetical protein